jgi:hypothetical protein
MHDLMPVASCVVTIRAKIAILFLALTDAASIFASHRANMTTPMAKRVYDLQTIMISTYCAFLLTFLLKKNLKGIPKILLIPGIYLIPFAVLVPEYVSRGVSDAARRF